MLTYGAKGTSRRAVRPQPKAGIMVNDVITLINGVPLQGLTAYQVVEKMFDRVTASNAPTI
jgi:hypothetical protein